MWYRIELNKDGSVKSCAEVEACIVEGKHIRYVEADSRASAVGLVQAWWRQRAAVAERTRNYRQKGLCDCSRPVERGRKSCEACRSRRRESQKRCRARQNGEIIPLRSSKPAATDAERALAVKRIRDNARSRSRERRRDMSDVSRSRLRALTEVLRQFDRATPRAFRAWLVAEIDKLTPTGRVDAALREILDNAGYELEETRQ
jgi:hypothetical protein